ncbi:Myb-like protein [Acrasis kona]|uniref:Myb-like protein n=1 Tax=Acrasis kona TaxID=1008807 RepID=A0AAW2ZJZ8_9EUKA
MRIQTQYFPQPLSDTPSPMTPLNESEDEEETDNDSDNTPGGRRKKKGSAKKTKKTDIKNKPVGVLKRKTCNRWTKKENEMLAKAIQLFGEKKWNDIAKYVGTKNSDQCNQHWHRVLNPKICKKPWTLEEDQSLSDRVTEYGESSWKKVAEGISGRTDIQCRHRWIMLKKYESQGKGRPLSRSNKTKTQYDATENSNSSGTMEEEDEPIGGADLTDPYHQQQTLEGTYQLVQVDPQHHMSITPCTPPRNDQHMYYDQMQMVDRQYLHRNIDMGLVCDEDGFDQNPTSLAVTPRSFFRNIKLEHNNNQDEPDESHLLLQSGDSQQPIIINRAIPHQSSLFSPSEFPVTFSTSETFREFFGSPKSGARAAQMRHMVTQDPGMMSSSKVKADQLFEQAYQEMNDYFIPSSAQMSPSSISQSGLYSSMDGHSSEDFLH